MKLPDDREGAIQTGIEAMEFVSEHSAREVAMELARLDAEISQLRGRCASLKDALEREGARGVA